MSDWLISRPAVSGCWFCPCFPYPPSLPPSLPTSSLATHLLLCGVIADLAQRRHYGGAGEVVQGARPAREYALDCHATSKVSSSLCRKDEECRRWRPFSVGEHEHSYPDNIARVVVNDSALHVDFPLSGVPACTILLYMLMYAMNEVLSVACSTSTLRCSRRHSGAFPCVVT